MAELLRQYPEYGEAWFALGMLLEHEEDFATAAKAYDRALEHGTAHAPELKQYMATFREFGREHDAGRVVGRGIVKLVIGIGVLLVLLFVYRIAARVIWDVSSHRAMKQEQKRRERRKKDNGPL
jgi:tetratricopeptide (TPR) repeat protein